MYNLHASIYSHFVLHVMLDVVVICTVKMTSLYSLASFTFLLEQVLQDLYPNVRKKCRSSLLFFSGCLCSSGLLYGMTGIDRTRVHDLEDDIVSIYLYIMIVWMGRISICTERGGISWII